MVRWFRNLSSSGGAVAEMYGSNLLNYEYQSVFIRDLTGFV